MSLCFNYLTNNNMKVLVKIVILLHLVVVGGFGQDKIKIEDYLEKVVNDAKTGEIILKNGKKSDSLYFSTPTLNRLFAKRMSYYLSGSNDLSLYKNYASINTKGFTVGHNFSFPSDPYRPTKNLLNTGLRIPITNEKAIVFQNDKIQQNISAFFNLAFFGNGSVFYNGDKEVTQMIKVRNFLKQTIVKKVDQERRSFNDVYDSTIKKDFEKFYDKKETGFEKGLMKKYREEFAEEEEAYGLEQYNKITKAWFIINGELPVTPTILTVINDSDKKIQKINFNPFVLGFQVGKFNETQDIRTILTLDVKLRHDSPFRFYGELKNLIQKDSLKAFARSFGITNISSTNDTISMSEPYSNMGTLLISPRIVVAFPNATFKLNNGMELLKGLGLNAFTQTSFNKYSTYHNVNVGAIFSMAGKDDKPINIEVLGTWVDIFNNLAPKESKSSPFVITVSLALPLSSALF